MNITLITTALKKITENPSVLHMPNIPFYVMDAGIFWNTIGRHGEYKLKQNTITQHCRIIDGNNIRRAWGSEEAMERLLEKIVWC